MSAAGFVAYATTASRSSLRVVKDKKGLAVGDGDVFGVLVVGKKGLEVGDGDVFGVLAVDDATELSEISLNTVPDGYTTTLATLAK